MSQTQESQANYAEFNSSELDAVATTLKGKLAEAELSHAHLAGMLNTCETKLAEILNVATSATAAKTQIVDEQAVIAAKLGHIQNAQEHADSVRVELDRIQISSTLNATEIEGQKQRGQNALDTVVAALAEINTQKISAEAAAAAANNSRDEAVTAASSCKALASKADAIEQSIEAYEQRLASLEKQAQAQLKTIVDLLPGATAAGLAYAFDDRRKTFLKPGVRWQWLFVGSVSLLVLLAFSGLWHVYESPTTLTWDELVRLWLARLPIAGALIWLAVHASREAALAKRLEEDYGYKAAIAASFQGFQKQMAEIANSTTENSPLGKLCGDTLATIANPPGRIYDRHQLTVMPGDELAAATAQILAVDGQKK
ncbi:hypothetical protein [Achromobacter deleyi]|uniref:hypothetical protein n=1 Tax=Achromobacter deleyi TaxID=1353891 RepID=UPI0014654E94|nr:hypothetical protein [Achromobacter deleyi]CAB3882529.1 hypothetical protein LMG3412_03333 [Achromobacter deleyi]